MLTALLDGLVMADRYGDGPTTVVALHGWARDRTDFGSTLAGYDGLALDLPGFGTSPAPTTAWSTIEYAQALAPLLTELDRPLLLGHSFGARVAIHLSALHPQSVRGLVLTGAPLRPTASGRSRGAPGYRMIRGLHRAGVVSDTRMEAARRKYGSADYRAARGVMRDVLVKSVVETNTCGYDASMAVVKAAGLPVRLAFGALDTAAPPVVAAAIAEATGAPAPTILSGSGHLIDEQLSTAIQAELSDLMAR